MSSGLEWVVNVCCHEGKVMPQWQRRADGWRGQVIVKQEPLEGRNRVAMVARFYPGTGQKMIEPLLDAQMVGCTSEWITLTGYERVITGALGEIRTFTQTWLLRVGAAAALERAEREWNNAARREALLRRQLQALKSGQPVPSE